jgi:hypothetical protein
MKRDMIKIVGNGLIITKGKNSFCCPIKDIISLRTVECANEDKIGITITLTNNENYIYTLDKLYRDEILCTMYSLCEGFGGVNKAGE